MKSCFFPSFPKGAVGTMPSARYRKYNGVLYPGLRCQVLDQLDHAWGGTNLYVWGGSRVGIGSGWGPKSRTEPGPDINSTSWSYFTLSGSSIHLPYEIGKPKSPSS